VSNDSLAAKPAHPPRRFYARLCISLMLVASQVASPSVARATRQQASFEQRLGQPVIVEGDSEPRWSVEERMRVHRVPGLGVAVFRHGRLAGA
jgi:hypothetical protein